MKPNPFFTSSQKSPDLMEKNKREIQDYLIQAAMFNDIKLRDAHHRNILFLGKTRVGKSTVFHVMKQLTYICDHTSIFSETQEPRLYSFTVAINNGEGPADEVNYNLNIIDTPGLFEQKLDRNDVRTNEVLKKTIYKCLEYEITKIHAIFLVCSFDTGINQEDILSMKQFIELFSGAEESICLLITRAETYSNETKEKMIGEILQHPQLKDIVGMIKNKIFFTGSLKYADYEAGSVESVKRDCENVYNMRKTLYQYVFDKETFCQISNLDFYKLKQAETRALMENIARVQQKEKKGSLTSDYEKIMMELERMKGFVAAEEKSESAEMFRKIMLKHEELSAQQETDSRN